MFNTEKMFRVFVAPFLLTGPLAGSPTCQIQAVPLELRITWMRLEPSSAMATLSQS
jgi:hypothetical protein